MSAMHYTMTSPLRRCSKCHKYLPATLKHFRKKNRKPGELHSWCRPCERKSQRAAYAKCPEKHRARSKNYRQKNPGKVKASYARWIAKNWKKRRKSKQRYYVSHRKEALAYSRAYYYAHQEKQQAVSRAWKAAHRIETRLYAKLYLIIHRESQQPHRQAAETRRRARKRQAVINDFTAAQWKAMQIAYNHCCAYCGKRYKGKLTQDHITPLSKGGANTVSNIVPSRQPFVSDAEDDTISPRRIRQAPATP